MNRQNKGKVSRKNNGKGIKIGKESAIPSNDDLAEMHGCLINIKNLIPNTQFLINEYSTHKQFEIIIYVTKNNKEEMEIFENRKEELITKTKKIKKNILKGILETQEKCRNGEKFEICDN
ncbi:hypothetical protein ACQ4LE_002818 [Meloidogyne hapla]